MRKMTLAIALVFSFISFAAQAADFKSTTQWVKSKFGNNDRVMLSDFGISSVTGPFLIFGYSKEFLSNQTVGAYTSVGGGVANIFGIDYKYFWDQTNTISNSWYGNAILEHNRDVRVEDVRSTSIGASLGRQWVLQRQLAIGAEAGLRHNDIARTSGVVGLELTYLF